MAAKSLPSPDILRQLLRYDPITGELFWLPRDVSFFSNDKGRAKNACSIWNGRYAGQPALNAIDAETGYRRGSIFDVDAYAHRVAWAIHYGEWPSGTIDHESGRGWENWITNLRDVTHAVNMQNVKKPVTNTTGHVGVYLSPSGKWIAQVKHGRKSQHLGTFDDIGDAVVAREAALHRLGFHQNHGKERSR